MAKLIEIKSQRRLEVICFLLFHEKLPPTEASMLQKFIDLGGNFILSSDVSKAIRDSLDMNENTFNVSLSRMIKKGFVIKKEGMLITHGVFMTVDDLLVKFF